MTPIIFQRTTRSDGSVAIELSNSTINARVKTPVAVTLDGAITKRYPVADESNSWDHLFQQHHQFHDPLDDQLASSYHLVTDRLSL
jgi:hypothetical protein